MRRALALVVALATGLSGGCVAGGMHRTASLFNFARESTAPAAEEGVVQLDVAVIECPLGDPYVDRGLWDLADEQALPFDRKSVLEDNGFRVGVIGGMLPAGLQALLSSERSCTKPRTLSMRVGNGMPVILGPPRAQCKFELVENGRSTTVELDEAQCQLQIMPSASENGKTVLRLTPHIKHGHPTLTPRPALDQSGTRRWDLQAQSPIEQYESLSWEITLNANQYVIVGTRLERTDTLGTCCFLTETGKPVQRLLVLRARQVEPSTSTARLGKSPPLALQAGWSAVRGTGP